MGPQTQKLIMVLDELAALLESDDENWWRQRMIEAKRRLEASDYSGIEHLLASYGGMGSFNDLVICQEQRDGSFSWKDGYREKNERLTQLRSSAWELATWISKNHEI
jgi:hypothetical protein